MLNSLLPIHHTTDDSDMITHSQVILEKKINMSTARRRSLRLEIKNGKQSSSRQTKSTFVYQELPVPTRHRKRIKKEKVIKGSAPVAMVKEQASICWLCDNKRPVLCHSCK